LLRAKELVTNGWLQPSLPITGILHHSQDRLEFIKGNLLTLHKYTDRFEIESRRLLASILTTS
jgi:hypothetical protein